MQELFVLEDIFNILIELETRGSEHYLKMVDLTSDYKLKELFRRLSEQEELHKEIYTKYKKAHITFDQSKNTLDYTEYTEYIRVLLHQTIGFLNEHKEVPTLQEGYTIAISLEMDTITFLLELKKLLDSNYFEALDEIIHQERQHLIALKEIKNSL